MSFIRTALAIVAFLFALNVRAADAPSAHVVLITIDGLAADYLTDVQTSMPTLRELIQQGVVSEGLRPINPSVTWPNHTTLITGVGAAKHSCFFNGVLERGDAGKPVKVNMNHNQAQLIAVPTLFDILHKQGRRTAAINWPCTRGSLSVDDNFPDVPDQIKHMTPRLRDQLIADEFLLDATDESFKTLGIVRKDEAWTAAVCRVIADSKPAFLAFHILTTDSIQHINGPKTTAAYAAMALADVKVKQVLNALDRAGIRKQTTVFVVADHGFARATKLILPNVAFRQNKLLTAGPTAIVAAKAMAIPEGGTALVYLADPATIDADRKKVIELMKATEGMADVIEPARYVELGFPDPAKNRQSPDLVLVGKEGYAFSNIATGEDVVIEPIIGRHAVGHHGYINTDPRMNAAFIVAGRGVHVHKKIGVIDNVHVAPTIAKLLGIELPGADGKALADVLIAP